MAFVTAIHPCNVERNDIGNIVGTNGGAGTKSQESLQRRGLERAIIGERKTCRGFVCACFSPADRRSGCPMRRPSRSPNFERAPWVWPHGDGRGRAPVDEQERVRTEDIWENLAPNHYLAAFNRECHAGQPASSKQECADQPEGDAAAGEQ
eukprot:3520524-Pyramimonas_sp.AAC.1